MKKLKSLLTSCVTAIAFMSAAPAFATVLTTPWQSAAFDLATIDDTASLDFLGFDSSLGTLIGVSIKFTMNETLTDTIYNFSNKAVNVGMPNSVSATSTITASGPLGLQTVNQLTTPGFSGTIAAGGGSIASPPTTNTTSTSVTDVMSGPASISGNPTTLANYIGGSNSVTITVNGIGTQNGSLSPNVLTGYDGNASGIVYLQYIYDIPEPATIALFALGLLALAQWRRRKG